MKMQTIVDDWRQHAEEHTSSNLAFLRSLRHESEKAVDRAARRLHREVFSIVDCTRCANCCKEMIPSFSEDEIETIAQHLGMESQQFAAIYLAKLQGDDQSIPRSKPCPFLGEDDRCVIYEVRPASCADFPCTNKARFATLSQFHSDNTVHCPAAFYVVEQMRARGIR